MIQFYRVAEYIFWNKERMFDDVRSRKVAKQIFILAAPKTMFIDVA